MERARAVDGDDGALDDVAAGGGGGRATAIGGGQGDCKRVRMASVANPRQTLRLRLSAVRDEKSRHGWGAGVGRAAASGFPRRGR